jgi:hypothetical protein
MLSLEASQAIAIACDGRQQDLDGDVALQPSVAGAIDLSHAAGSEGRDDLVGTEPRAECERQESVVNYLGGSPFG